MTNARRLHVKRLREGLEQISRFQQGDVTAHDPDFRTWRERIQHSLGMLFGEDHHYSESFEGLTFWQQRFTPFDAEPVWDSGDQHVFREDLEVAKALLGEALEELLLTSES